MEVFIGNICIAFLQRMILKVSFFERMILSLGLFLGNCGISNILLFKLNFLSHRKKQTHSLFAKFYIYLDFKSEKEIKC